MISNDDLYKFLDGPYKEFIALKANAAANPNDPNNKADLCHIVASKKDWSKSSDDDGSIQAKINKWQDGCIAEQKFLRIQQEVISKLTAILLYCHYNIKGEKTFIKFIKQVQSVGLNIDLPADKWLEPLYNHITRYPWDNHTARAFQQKILAFCDPQNEGKQIIAEGPMIFLDILSPSWIDLLMHFLSAGGLFGLITTDKVAKEHFYDNMSTFASRFYEQRKKLEISGLSM